ncbi:MAG TPA: efflux RND transporter periplasmic adaptor subunit [Candidatus Acidoferrales bacterium]|nr:efflux RND transporter periplasmic adaptor subunit [Candidatus Acidoferrales bacterium]
MKLLFPIPLVLALVCLATGCSRSNAPKGGPAVPVVTAPAIVTNMPVLVDPAPVGHVMPVSSVAIRAQLGGIISTVEFHEGQEVKKGDLLFTLDPRPEQAALVQAQANLQRDAAQLENSKIQFNREQKLYDSKLVSQDEYDTSRAAFDTLVGTVAADHAAITNAELNVEFTQIRSPVDGRTGSIQFREGNVVKSPDDVLLTINQIHPIYVAFAIAESFLPEIQKQMRNHVLAVSASYENMTGDPATGELTFVDNSVDTTTGTILLKATFPNEDDKLWPGQFVTVSIRLDELTNAVVVPSQAVQTGQNGQMIYVVKPDLKAEARPVNTGLTYGNWTVISSGVQAGETVVTDGQLRLAPGVLVSDKKQSATNAP